jgi:hypothetical protein
MSMKDLLVVAGNAPSGRHNKSLPTWAGDLASNTNPTWSEKKERYSCGSPNADETKVCILSSCQRKIRCQNRSVDDDCVNERSDKHVEPAVSEQITDNHA